MAEAAANATFAAAFAALGLHYACNTPDSDIELVIQKKFWASEDWSTQGNWSGASCWGRLLNQNYVRMNMTSTIAWSLVWAVSAALPAVYAGAGLLLADEPWSGHFQGGLGGPAATLDGPLFITAHTTQFVEPGWLYLHVPGGGSGLLPAALGNGSYVTLVPPDRSKSGFTLIVEKLAGDCLNCATNHSTAGAVLTFATAGGLAGPGSALQLWRSNETAQFWRDADLVVAADGSFSFYLAADAIATVSTVAGARKGVPSAAVPAPGAFPLPFVERFSGYAEDDLPRFFSDQQGSFAVRGGALRQVVPIDPGENRWAVEDVDPMTLIGDGGLADVIVSVSAAFPAINPANASATTYVQVCARITHYTVSEGRIACWRARAFAHVRVFERSRARSRTCACLRARALAHASCTHTWRVVLSQSLPAVTNLFLYALSLRRASRMGRRPASASSSTALAFGLRAPVPPRSPRDAWRPALTRPRRTI